MSGDNMTNTMIIRNDDGSWEYYMCYWCPVPCINESGIPTTKIPIFYSKRHAMESGWVFGNNIHSSLNRDQESCICPDCANTK